MREFDKNPDFLDPFSINEMVVKGLEEVSGGGGGYYHWGLVFEPKPHWKIDSGGQSGKQFVAGLYDTEKQVNNAKTGMIYDLLLSLAFSGRGVKGLNTVREVNNMLYPKYYEEGEGYVDLDGEEHIHGETDGTHLLKRLIRSFTGGRFG